MKVDGKREFKLLEEIGFVRMGATEKEDEAADILIKRLKEVGVEAQKEEFSTMRSDVLKAELEVLEPYHKKYEVKGYRNAKATPEEGITAEIAYAPDDTDVTVKDCKGKIVLNDSYVGSAAFHKIKKAEAVGFVGTGIATNVYTKEEDQDVDEGEFRPEFKKEYDVPGVVTSAKNMMEMVDKGATKAKITLLQDQHDSPSRNVVAKIPGSDGDQTIVFTAHYDSVEYSHGVYDNGSGAVCLYELAAYFAKHQPKANLIFVWCGCEERGLLGSKAYVEAHKEEVKDYSLCINIDMIGSIMGKFIAVSTAEQSLVDYTDYFGKIKGYALTARQGVYSSDSTPFADAGVPAVSFARIAGNNYGPIHCRHDVLEHMSEDTLAKDTDFVLSFAKKMANAYVIPVPHTMPDNMKDELDQYLGRKPMKPKRF